MPETREALALELSESLLAAQRETEGRLRKRAQGIVQAASVVIPVAAIGVGGGPKGVAAAIILAALCYAACVWYSVKALAPLDLKPGIRGGALLAEAKATGASIDHMRERAAEYLDKAHEHNRKQLDEKAENVEKAAYALAWEVISIAAAVVVTVLA
jgi:hypothetical protein